MSWTLAVPPGRHTLRLRCDGKPMDAPGDPRRMVWRSQQVLVEPLD